MASGPFLLGGVSRNNQTSVSFTAGTDVPVGSLIWVLAGTNIPDTADVSVVDSVGNGPGGIYVNQSFVDPNGLNAPILVAVARVTTLLPAAGTITINSSVRGNWDANAYFFTGARGEIFSTDVEQFAVAITNPVATVQAQQGMQLFGALAVVGPSSDGFTNDPNWGADQKGNIARTNVTLHASGRIAQSANSFSYAPILGTARRSLIFAAAFL